MKPLKITVSPFFVYGLVTGSIVLPLALILRKKLKAAEHPKKKKLNSTVTIVADIGGTNSRFQLIEVDATMLAPKVLFTKKYPSNDFDSFSDLLKLFLQESKEKCSKQPNNAVIAMAGPVKCNTVTASNLKKWGVLDGDELAKEFNLDSFIFLNDFEAIAYSILKLQKNDVIQVNEGVPGIPNEKIAVQGPGTGLGYCSIIPAPYKNGIRYYVWGGEGGHAAFSPINKLQSQYMMWFM